MNQYHANQALNEGFVIKHRLFTNDEFLHRCPENGQLMDETGLALNELEFWRIRQDEIWKEGWELHLLELPPPPKALVSASEKTINDAQILARGTGKTRSLEYQYFVGRPTLKLPRKRKKKFIKEYGRKAYLMYIHRLLFHPKKMPTFIFTDFAGFP